MYNISIYNVIITVATCYYNPVNDHMIIMIYVVLAGHYTGIRYNQSEII
jgi:hypothetical protein